MRWVLLRVSDELWQRVEKYLRGLKAFFRVFPQVEYRVEVTAEERLAANKLRDVDINPPRAWQTCASCREIWDMDGRGPYPLYDHELRKKGDKSPRGMGWIETPYGKKRVAGDCANPSMLNYLQCPKFCTCYEPTTIEGLVWLSIQTAEEHERRAALLRQQAEFYLASEKQYLEAISTGDLIIYKDGRFIMNTPPESDIGS